MPFSGFGMLDELQVHFHVKGIQFVCSETGAHCSVNRNVENGDDQVVSFKSTDTELKR